VAASGYSSNAGVAATITLTMTKTYAAELQVKGYGL